MTHNLDKPKRKHAPNPHRRLHILLVAWMVIWLVAAYYQPIWVMPPHIGLTSYIYVGAFLVFLPFTIRHIWQHGWHWLTIVLIVGCLGTIFCVGRLLDYYGYPPNELELWTIKYGDVTVRYEYRQPSSYFAEYSYTPLGNLPVGLLTYRVEGWGD